MSLPLFPEHGDFSKICFIPSLQLSCFGCCGHHFKDKKAMHAFMDENKKILKRYKDSGKTHREFMEREHLLHACGGCYSLIREKQPEGHTAYVCAVHPFRIGGVDIRIDYCDYGYLCKTAAFVNTLDEQERALFYRFLKEQEFESFEYSLINSEEDSLLAMYMEWKKTELLLREVK